MTFIIVLIAFGAFLSALTIYVGWREGRNGTGSEGELEGSELPEDLQAAVAEIRAVIEERLANKQTSEYRRDEEEELEDYEEEPDEYEEEEEEPDEYEEEDEVEEGEIGENEGAGRARRPSAAVRGRREHPARRASRAEWEQEEEAAPSGRPNPRGADK